LSATATSVGERGNDISLTSFSRHSLATTPVRNLIIRRSACCHDQPIS
jgi:hypothetical protein